MLRRVGEEVGVHHAERIDDAGFQKCVQALPGDHFDHAAQHVGRAAVLPMGARLVR
jgi:hypothetical protein